MAKAETVREMWDRFAAEDAAAFHAEGVKECEESQRAFDVADDRCALIDARADEGEAL